MNRHVRSHRRSERDEGAVLLWVAVSMVALIGMGALVIDIGALYWEKRQLQNGADAAALAVAQDCAEGDCLDEYATADNFVDRNAKDGASNVDTVCGEGPGLGACASTPPGTEGVEGWVQVNDSTATPGGGTEVDFFLAPVLDLALDGSTVHAKAIAAWGPLGTAVVTPLIFSVCEFIEMGGSLEGDGTVPTGANWVYFHDTTQAGTCPAGPSGGDDPISGGFGWLESTNCLATISSGGWVKDKPGVAVVNGCNPRDWRDQVIVIAIYDGTNGLNGANGSYHVAGFVGIHVLGYRFSGDTWPNGFQCPESPGNSGRCIYGEFTEVTTLDGDIGGGGDYGARVVKMIG